MINPYLDTLIGVAVIYFVFSILAYVIQEFWAAFKESRGRMLRKAIYDLLNDNLNKGYGVLLFDHPQFNFLKRTDNRLPSYLPSSNFADALIDLIAREAYDLQFPPKHLSGEKESISVAAEDQDTAPSQVMAVLRQDFNESINKEGISSEENLVKAVSSPERQFEYFRIGLQQMRTSNLKILLQNLLANSVDLPSLRANIETWYNDYMDRVTGWYKMRVTFNLRFIGIGLALLFYIQLFDVVTSIYRDRQLRDKLVNIGQQIVDNPAEVQAIYTSSVNAALAEIDSNCNRMMRSAGADRKAIADDCLKQRIAVADSFARLRLRQGRNIMDSVQAWDLPIGWDRVDNASALVRPLSWIWDIIGLVLSGLAISAGAPFWFDVLNKLFNIRRTGIKPATKVSTQTTDKK